MASPGADRRGFFRRFAGEGAAFLDEIQGRPQIPISDLSKVPDAELARQAPVIREGVAILPEEQQVSARLPGEEMAIVLFSREPAHLFIFNRLNGRTTLGQTSRELSAEMGWTEEQSFVAVKALFFRLVRLRVCVSSNFVREPGNAPG
jgi:hypothetical protein